MLCCMRFSAVCCVACVSQPRERPVSCIPQLRYFPSHLQLRIPWNGEKEPDCMPAHIIKYNSSYRVTIYVLILTVGSHIYIIKYCRCQTQTINVPHAVSEEDFR